jgi:hypothetical protein
VDRELSRFYVSVVCSTSFIIAGFAFSYFLWSHDGLPVGWDTPFYIGESKIVASQGPLALISIQGPYDFLYQMVAGFLVWTGMSATSVETYLPIGLSALFPYLLSRLTLIQSDLRLATFVALATPGWYAIYRIAGDLHANLLGLVLLLTAITLISRVRSLRQPRALLGLSLVGLASFTHIETTLFFAAVILISSLSARTLFSVRVAVSVVATTVPAAGLFAVHFLQLLGLTGGTLALLAPGSVDFWLLVLGPLLPLAVIGFYSSLARRNSWLEVFVGVWALGSITIGISQYFNPEASIFAQRAATIFPTPLLAAFGLRRLLAQDAGPTLHWLRSRLSTRWVLVVVLLLLVISWPVAYGQAAKENQRVFLTSSAYHRLQWISNTYGFSTVPIFIYNDVDQYAGGLGDFYNNWVSAVVGTHLSYLGRVDYLVQLQQTPFSNLISREISEKFMRQILDSANANKTALLRHPFVLVKDFYNPPPIPTYVSGLFHEVSDGVFIGNITILGALKGITQPLYSSMVATVGPWNSTMRSWSQSGSALEVQTNSFQKDIEASYLLAVRASGTYTIGLRYWDGIGSDLSIILDGGTIGITQYSTTNRPLLQNITAVSLSVGVHNLTIRVNRSTVSQRYASLDYLALTQG